MRRLLLIAMLLPILLAAAPKPRVSLEIVTDKQVAPDAASKWSQLLTDLGVSGLRIRQATGRDEISIEKEGTKEAPAFKITGFVAANGTLQVPGGKFSLNDRAKLREWLDNLGEHGVEGITQARSAFGLLPGQLQQIDADLKQAVTASTKDVAAPQAVVKIASRLQWPLASDPAADAALAKVVVAEELQGLSSGTSLAIILRPAGLVLTPEQVPGGKLHYRVSKPRAGRESWPIGWKPEGPARKVFPDLYELINVEIKDIPTLEALDAIEQRLELPFIYDRNALALLNVDLAKLPAAVPSKRMSYSQVLQKLLFQPRLKPEVRTDEAGKPFLWITSLKAM